MRVSNLSLGSTSQVKQQLKFEYSAIDMVSELVQEIRKEIQGTMAETLITDGSRPFRIHWTSLGEKALVVDVDCRLRIPPLTDEYYDARQEILEAIARAAKRCNVAFAGPASDR